MSLKAEQLGVAEEKSLAQGTLYAVTRRRLNALEKEVVAVKERNAYLEEQVKNYDSLLGKDVIKLRPDVRKELEKSFLYEFQKSVTQMSKELAEA